MSLEAWLTYVATVTILVLSPGPSVLLATTRALEHGAARSFATIAGDLSANALQIVAAVLGLGAVIASSPAALELVRWGGVLYLAFLGIKLTFSSAREDHDAGRPVRGGGFRGDDDRTIRRLYLEGFGVSIANPKAVVFFAALFPSFLDSEVTMIRQLLVLGLTYLVLDGSALALWTSAARRLQQLWPDHRVTRLPGVLLLAASIGLAIK